MSYLADWLGPPDLQYPTTTKEVGVLRRFFRVLSQADD